MLSDLPEDNTPQPTCNGLFSGAEWDCLLAHLSLPCRQAEILRLLLSGECDKQIAEQLDISLPTIRTHLQRIYSRFGVTNRTTLAIEVFRRFRTLETKLS